MQLYANSSRRPSAARQRPEPSVIETKTQDKCLQRLSVSFWTDQRSHHLSLHNHVRVMVSRLTVRNMQDGAVILLASVAVVAGRENPNAAAAVHHVVAIALHDGLPRVSCIPYIRRPSSALKALFLVIM
eukprot:TRINITY_DN30727_c0_g2_i11.p2 TRINITY_DN30727_c0_g2~~TRINITY_DN30727_c0_g2_i11.p2  ORF type:complete len:129 (-),score=0.10 TRINITY_DN30727_c0_g2_i11:235-621(-)